MQPSDASYTPRPRPRRPFLVTLLAEVFIVCGLAGGLRAYAAVQDWNLILELGIQPGPLYFLLTGLLWAFTGLIGGLGLLTGWYHSERLGYFCTSLLLISYWADRLLASRVGTLPPNGAFAAAISAAGLALALLALSRPNARRYLNRMSRRKVVYDQRTGN